MDLRLEAGEALRIADFRCGEGWAGIYLAEAYPNVRIDGYDVDDASIAAAREHASARGVADRVQFDVRDLRQPERGTRYDGSTRLRGGKGFGCAAAGAGSAR